MASPSTVWILAGAAVLGASQVQSFGVLAPRTLFIALVGALCWSRGLARSGAASEEASTLATARAAAFLVAAAALVITWVVPAGFGLGGPRFNPFVLTVLHATGTAALIGYLPEVTGGKPAPGWVRRARLPALYLAAAGMGAWMLYTVPEPPIDVFALHQQGAEKLLALQPVYGNVSVIDTNTHARVIEDYVYPPFSLLLTTLTFPITGDTRWSVLLAMLASAALVQRIARRRVGEGDVLPELLAAGLLFYPRAPFVLGNAWGDPLALPFIAGFALLADMGRRWAASVVLGLACATKQHLLVFGVSALLAPGIGLLGGLVAGLTVLATLLPFALWTPVELWEGLVTHHLGNPFRDDALSLPAFFHRLGLPEAPGWLGFVAIPVVCLAALRLPRRIDVALGIPIVALTWFFLFGRQAFANYYYLVVGAAFVWAALCVGRSPSETRATD